MRITPVEFSDGTYGIRKGWFSFKYLDLKAPGYWWSRDNGFIRDCRGSKRDCIKVLNGLLCKEKPVSVCELLIRAEIDINKTEKVTTFTELLQTQEKYNELIAAVGNKYPGGSRHQTALSYILRAEKIADKPQKGVKL